jgi:D-sedoheptulose 7-phosphate isomerase
MRKKIVASRVDEHLRTFHELKASGFFTSISKAMELVTATFQAGRKILICGNGGSAADAQHLAAEIVGHFQTKRLGLPAIALSTDSSILTALGNDLGFRSIFARQVDALGKPNDCLVAISTSGQSPNVLDAIDAAHRLKMKSIGLSGHIALPTDVRVCVPSHRTPYIQEAHVFAIHAIAAAVDIWAQEE